MNKKYLIKLTFFIAISLAMISGCIYKEIQVGGMYVAFEQSTKDDEINFTLEKINFNVNYTWEHIDYMGQKYYIITPKDNLNTIEFLRTDGYKELNTTLYYSDADVKKKDNNYVILLEGSASVEEAQQILKPHNIEVKKIVWVHIGWTPAVVSEEVAKKWQNELGSGNKVIGTFLVTMKG